VDFATKPVLARRMLERALEAGLPHAWITADEVYGQDRRLRRWLEERGQAYVLAIPAQERRRFVTEQGFCTLRVDELADSFLPEAWNVLSAGRGAKGERLYEWAFLAAGQQAAEANAVRGLLVRRSLEDAEERAYYAVFAP
jgi:SRSO17 transposase